MNNRITLNIPHSSIGGLDEANWNSWEELVRSVNEWTDWHTNIMFRPDRNLFNKDEVKPFVFHKSRFVVDAERLINDDMESIGQGIVYTQFGEHLHRSVTKEEMDALYKEREAYLSKMEQHIIDNDRAGYNNILIDCHSFPSWCGDVDICIGFNEDFSRPSDEKITQIKRIFERDGYLVGINFPYSNSLQPIKDIRSLKNGYFSFMIELNKRIYLNEETRALSPNAHKAMETLSKLYIYLLS